MLDDISFIFLNKDVSLDHKNLLLLLLWGNLRHLQDCTRKEEVRQDRLSRPRTPIRRPHGSWQLRHRPTRWIRTGQDVSIAIRRGVLELCSIGLLVIFWAMAALMACGGRVARIINEGLWMVKYVLMWVVVIVTALVGIGKGYGKIAAIVAVGFLPIEGVVLIDLFYIFGRALVKRY